jgi:hypothetical protein
MPNLTTEMGRFLSKETASADIIQHQRTPFTLQHTNEYASVIEIAQAASR